MTTAAVEGKREEEEEKRKRQVGTLVDEAPSLVCVCVAGATTRNGVSSLYIERERDVYI